MLIVSLSSSWSATIESQQGGFEFQNSEALVTATLSFIFLFVLTSQVFPRAGITTHTWVSAGLASTYRTVNRRSTSRSTMAT